MQIYPHRSNTTISLAFNKDQTTCFLTQGFGIQNRRKEMPGLDI